MLVPSNRTHTQEPPVTTALPRYLWAIVAALALTLSLATPAAAKTTGVLAMGFGLVGEPNVCSVDFATTDGTGYHFEGTWTSNTSNSGNVTFTCRGELTSAPPAQAINAANPEQDFPCWDGENKELIFTPTWDLHVTPAGNATYSCQYKAN
jgi:hypothetical protein